MTELLNEALNMLKKYPDRVPVICDAKREDFPALEKNKFLVPKQLTILQFACVIRRQIKIHPEDAIFIICKDKVLNPRQVMGELYATHKDAGGFLHLYIQKEICFGNHRFLNNIYQC